MSSFYNLLSLLFSKTNLVLYQAQITYIPRVPQCQSHCRNRTPPRPLSRNQVCTPPPPEPKEGGHTRLLVRGWRSPNSDDWRKGLALCLLCGSKSQLAFLLSHLTIFGLGENTTKFLMFTVLLGTYFMAWTTYLEKARIFKLLRCP